MAPVARDDAVEQHEIRYDARHRAWRVACMRDRRHARLRITVDRGPQRHDAVQRGRNPDRAAGIRTDPAGREPRGDRASVTAARATGYARLVVRIPDGAESAVIARDAERQLVQVRLAQNDRAGVDERLHNGRVCAGHEVLQAGRAGGIAHSGDVDVVFHDERHAMQRAEMLAITAARLVGCLRGADRTLLVDGDECVQPRVRRDFREQRSRQLLARDPPFFDQLRRLSHRELRQVLGGRTGARQQRQRGSPCRSHLAERSHLPLPLWLTEQQEYACTNRICRSPRDAAHHFRSFPASLTSR